ncbi:hypothetical protein QTO05_23920 [Vibrio fortis]|jgi:hypothetical protein|uniref:hypothetical protein n=1 Tax=Vibrio TaxID=662 RepID=UPI0017851939|nr:MULTISPECIES: hypothetical protein [Vibrio]MCG9630411.1 hypothetical protein [Vibrio sp. Isolate30]
MNALQFEALKQQIHLLSNQQLIALQGEIDSKVDNKQEPLLTDEEMKALSELFS